MSDINEMYLNPDDDELMNDLYLRLEQAVNRLNLNGRVYELHSDIKGGEYAIGLRIVSNNGFLAMMIDRVDQKVIEISCRDHVVSYHVDDLNTLVMYIENLLNTLLPYVVNLTNAIDSLSVAIGGSLR